VSGLSPDLQPPAEGVALGQHLDFCRSAAVARINDLDDERASRQPLPQRLSLWAGSSSILPGPRFVGSGQAAWVATAGAVAVGADGRPAGFAVRVEPR
jgi:hypothetical protein